MRRKSHPVKSASRHIYSAHDLLRSSSMELPSSLSASGPPSLVPTPPPQLPSAMPSSSHISPVPLSSYYTDGGLYFRYPDKLIYPNSAGSEVDATPLVFLKVYSSRSDSPTSSILSAASSFGGMGGERDDSLGRALGHFDELPRDLFDSPHHVNAASHQHHQSKNSGNNSSNNGSKKSCSSCGTKKTPYWRDGWEPGILLCNACGIRYQKYKRFCADCNTIARKDDRGRLHCPSCQLKL